MWRRARTGSVKSCTSGTVKFCVLSMYKHMYTLEPSSRDSLLSTFYMYIVLSRPVIRCRGGCAWGGEGARRSPKGLPGGIVTKNNVVMVGLTISMHFQQFEKLKFQIFSGGAHPRAPLKALCLRHLHDLSFQCYYFFSPHPPPPPPMKNPGCGLVVTAPLSLP